MNGRCEGDASKTHIIKFLRGCIRNVIRMGYVEKATRLRQDFHSSAPEPSSEMVLKRHGFPRIITRIPVLSEQLGVLFVIIAVISI